MDKTLNERYSSVRTRPGLGEVLRHLQDLVDGSSADLHRQLSFAYRPRYTPVMRALMDGPASVSQLKGQLSVTQGAVSQTIKLMLEDSLITTAKGKDARQTIVSLSPLGESALAILEPRWGAMFDAIAELEKEVGMPLLAGLQRAAEALEAKPFADRIDASTPSDSGQPQKTSRFFQDQGDRYLAFRPMYPPALGESLASLVTKPAVALDVGCGSGQLTAVLAPNFDTVFAVDPSASQLSHAPQINNVTYLQQSAEDFELPESTVDLVVAAQAAHWFDLDAFYRCARQVAKPDAVLALVTYGVPYLAGPVNTAFQQGYWGDLHDFWSPERLHVETGYESLPFPFAPLEAPGLSCRKTMTLDQFVGYITTWSAFQTARQSDQLDRFDIFFEQLKGAWGSSETVEVIWPITVRAGLIHS